MSIATTNQHGPSTPPMSDHYSLSQTGLRPELSMALPYQQGLMDENSFRPPSQMSAFSSPQAEHAVINEYEMPTQMEYANAHVTAPYPLEALYRGQGQNYHYLNPGSYGRSSTPHEPGALGRTARNPRRLAPNSYPRSPSPPKRKKVAKRDLSKRSKLEKPLSELTAHLTHIPIKDTEAWVKRSPEQRQKEVGNDGFIKRPSNSFILYRSAYADRCREYEKSNNHQDISSMAGASWAIESLQIRRQYEEWAKMERENHQAAFPDYKFQPQTQEAKARKRKERLDDDSLEESELDDPTYLGRGATPGSSRSTKTKRMRRGLREPSYTPSLGSEGDWGSPDPYGASISHSSVYQSATPRHTLPLASERTGQHGGYYLATSHPNMRFSGIGHVEDIVYRSSDPAYDSYSTEALTALHGLAPKEFEGDVGLDNGHLTFTAPVLDPELVAFNHALPSQIHAEPAAPADDYLGGMPHDFEIGDEHTEGLAKWNHLDHDNFH